MFESVKQGSMYASQPYRNKTIKHMQFQQLNALEKLEYQQIYFSDYELENNEDELAESGVLKMPFEMPGEVHGPGYKIEQAKRIKNFD